MSSVTVLAYAKINLTLDILGLRPDNYHEIRSIMQTIALHDTVVVTRSPSDYGITLAVDGDEAAGVPADLSNIVCQAANRMRALAEPRDILHGSRTGSHIALTKRIPSQAGLGGGSSDCAATLVALNQLLELNLEVSELVEIAAQIGSDVPFFLTRGTARAEGRGERVAALAPYRPGAWLVIVKPPVGVSTPAAYAALDAQSARTYGCATAMWERGDKRLSNDFHEVVISQNPAVKAACDVLQFGDGEPPLLCGSGSALFRIMPSESEAKHLSGFVQAARVGKVWVTQLAERQE